METHKRERYNKFLPLGGMFFILCGVSWILGTAYFLYYSPDKDKIDFLSRFLMISFGPMFAIAGLIIFFKALEDNRNLKLIKHSGKRCIGEVKQIYTVAESGERTHNTAIYAVNHSTYVVYGFTAENGEKLLTQIGNIYKKDNLNLGDQIEIIYNHKNPKLNFWVGEIE